MWPDSTWKNTILGTRFKVVCWWYEWSGVRSLLSEEETPLTTYIDGSDDVTSAFFGYKEAWISDKIFHLPGLVGFDCEKTKHLFFIIDLSLHPAGPVISALTGSDEKYNRCVDIFLRITQVRLLVIQNYSEIHGCC